MFVDKYRPTKVSEMILTSEVKKLITGIKKKKTVPGEDHKHIHHQSKKVLKKDFLKYYK